jgi:predicted nucleic acid-binding protein
MSNKAVVLDANILIRAVLGKRARELLIDHAAAVKFFAPDADDWPVLACAMTIGCPIWTEDADFFGTGVATWTTDRIELYLAD